MNKPPVSLIVPIYNSENHLLNLFQTLSEINYSNLEILFIDNNSIDNSEHIIKNFIKKNISNHKFKILSEPRQGAGLARNKGINEANGDYIAFLDSDDWMAPDKICKSIDIFENNTGVDFVFSRGYREYESGEKLFHPTDGIQLKTNTPPSLGYVWLKSYFHLQHIGSIIIKKTCAMQVNCFPDIRIGEDWIFQVKIGLNFSGYFINECQTIYFRHSDSTMSNTSSIQRAKYEVELRLLMYSDNSIIMVEGTKKILEKDLTLLFIKMCLNNEHNDLKIRINQSIKIPFLIKNRLSIFFTKQFKSIFKNPFFWFWKYSYRD